LKTEVQPRERQREVSADKTFDRALEGYARAWAEVAQMTERELPVLEHHKIALRERRQELDAIRPEAGADLTPTLAQIAKAQNIAAQHLGVIQKYPALRMTSAEHGEQIKRAGAAVMGEAVRHSRDAATEARIQVSKSPSLSARHV
jgi:hypothetical protein